MKNFINFLPPWVETNIQPAFYDKQSGTCLQQTARMYAKVNQLVRIANEQYETIADYIQRFITLKDYVEDYFDNLDVQEEINLKLDQMAEDGVLTDLVSEFFGEQLEEINDSIDYRLTTFENTVNTQLAHNNDLVNSVVQSRPVPVSSTSDMTNTSLIYVLTTDGKWYYYDGANWTAGGDYQASSLTDGAVAIPNLNQTIQEAIGLIGLTPTWTDGQYLQNSIYITQYGFSTSAPIELKEGSTIYFNAKGYTTVVDIIDTCDSDGNNRKRVVGSIDSNPHQYSYTALKDTYVILCSVNSGIGFAFIDENINSRLDSVVENTIEKLTEVYINKTNVKNNYYINSKGSEVQHNYGVYAVTGYIPVSELSHYILHNVWNVTTIDYQVCYAFYDNSQDFISATSMGGDAETEYSFETPQKAKYFRATVSQVNIDRVKLFLNENIISLNDKITNDNQVEDKNTLFTAFNKFGVIGDSLASGEAVAVVNGSTRYIDNYDYSWGQYIARKYGMECINFSAGGLTTRSWLTSNVGLVKLQNSANKCNSYIIGLGVNDKNVLGDAYLGSISDIKENFMDNEDTYYGNYGKIISYIKQVQPKAKIFLLTMPDQTAPSTVDYSNFNTAVRTIAGYFDNVYLIDLAGDHNNTFNSGFVRANLRGGHYNAIGYDYIGDKIYDWLSKYMLDNSANFRQIEFIGTDYSY